MTDAPASEMPAESTTEQANPQVSSAPSSNDLAAMIKDLAKKQEDFARKINKEMKRRRLGLEEEGGEEGSLPQVQESSGQAADWRAARELARLEATLPREILEDLEKDTEGRSLAETVAAYRLASRLAERVRPAKGNEQDEPSSPRRTGKGASPQQPSSKTVAHPATILEYKALTKEQRKILVNDPTFKMPYE